MDTRVALSAAAERNKEPIRAVLADVLPTAGRVLEIASGTGQHVLHFATAMPSLVFQPSERDEAGCAALSGALAAQGLPNVLSPCRLDVERPWPAFQTFDALICINMIHIAPWSATDALFAGARLALRSGAPVVLYGPFRIDGEHTAESNRVFDAWLQERDPRSGVRDLAAVTREAETHGFAREQVVSMPANNLSLVFRRA
jgi:cyclopropane fatty-acyl-phospholipid synthase-like methyltransferase